MELYADGNAEEKIAQILHEDGRARNTMLYE